MSREPDNHPPQVDTEQLLEELDHTRTRIHGFIDDADHSSSRAVLNVSAQMHAVVTEANDYVTMLNERMSSLTESNEGSLTQVVREQLQVVHDYLGRVQGIVDEQHRIAQQAVEQSQGIYKAGSLIGQMTQAVKILALNAQIEASRLGVDNQALGVISQEMLRLSKTVNTTNRAVRSLTQGLADTLPTLATQAEALADETRQFSEDLTIHSSRVERSNEDLMELVMTSLNEGDIRIATILDRSYTVLSELQFQDPMVQTIQRIDAELFEMTKRLVPQAEENIRASEYLVNLGDTLHDEDVEMDEEEREELASLESGDVLLF